MAALWSSSATTTKELQSAAILAMIPRGAQERLGPSGTQQGGEVADGRERVHLLGGVQDLLRAPFAERAGGKRMELCHDLVGRHGVGRVAAYHAGGLGKTPAVAELDAHVRGRVVGALERHLLV